MEKEVLENQQQVVIFQLHLQNEGKKFCKLVVIQNVIVHLLLTGFLIPTIIDTLQAKDYHYEDVWPEDVIYQGYVKCRLC
jgi:hypothetical protein